MENFLATNKISGVERDVVLVSLYSYKSNLILSSKDDKPAIVPINSYGIPAQNLIFIPKQIFINSLPHFTENTEITVCFFYQGRGIFFKGIPKSTVNGYGLFIPKILYKQQDKEKQKTFQATANLFYTGQEEKGRFLTCFSNEKFPLFTPFLWNYFSETDLLGAEKYLEEIANLKICNNIPELEKIFEKKQKILYLPEPIIPSKNYFPYEATFTTKDDLRIDFNILKNEVYIPFSDKNQNINKPHTICTMIQELVTISPLDIEDSVSSLPICKFLSTTSNEIKSVQGRFSPLQILYINDGMIILGLEDGDFPLQLKSEYPISIYVDLPIGKREIFVTVFVSRLYTNKDFDSKQSNGNSSKRTAAICKYTSIKEEDRRFLFEKTYNSLYT